MPASSFLSALDGLICQPMTLKGNKWWWSLSHMYLGLVSQASPPPGSRALHFFPAPSLSPGFTWLPDQSPPSWPFLK